MVGGTVTVIGPNGRPSARPGAGMGGFRYTFTLESDCVRGTKWKVVVVAQGGAAGVGLPASIDLSAGASFEDGLSSIDPYIFNGDFISIGASLSWGGGVSYSGTSMGGAYSSASFTGVGGFSEGVGALSGSAHVESATPEECGCGNQ